MVSLAITKQVSIGGGSSQKKSNVSLQVVNSSSSPTSSFHLNSTIGCVVGLLTTGAKHVAIASIDNPLGINPEVASATLNL